MIKVSVIGAHGRMGRTVVGAVDSADDMVIAQQLDAGDSFDIVNSQNTDIAVDFTVPSVTLNNVLELVRRDISVVVGTTGWTEEKYEKIRTALADHPKVGVFIAPNFAISAVLADYFAGVAARYFESAEVIELHHPDKVDAPSGTAIHTAHTIADARRAANLRGVPDGTQNDTSARGEVIDGIHVHAVRLRGLNAHEEVLLGNAGEQLTIRADSFDRGSFMPGVLLAIRNMATQSHPGLTVGLDSFLNL
ncbi:4-hydroxy-tetrahydrodipicolinate reductase [Bifidobacterium aquikefiri]|uniref:4-hydroxy-tetrahydrodipicolinate reductase n=1 Tax=Bifidobacterium aquikefiri TaxID=1653207 RepID=UPI0023F55945|nr:4-hydroxy-tetrahydrodipicolinate reductase [Bifidobacterium aquikefiri]